MSLIFNVFGFVSSSTTASGQNNDRFSSTSISQNFQFNSLSVGQKRSANDINRALEKSLTALGLLSISADKI